MLRRQRLLHSWLLPSGATEGEGFLDQAQSLVLKGFVTLRSQTPLIAPLKASLMILTWGMVKAMRRRKKKRMMMMKRRWSTRL